MRGTAARRRERCTDGTHRRVDDLTDRRLDRLERSTEWFEGIADPAGDRLHEDADRLDDGLGDLLGDRFGHLRGDLLEDRFGHLLGDRFGHLLGDGLGHLLGDRRDDLVDAREDLVDAREDLVDAPGELGDGDVECAGRTARGRRLGSMRRGGEHGTPGPQAGCRGGRQQGASPPSTCAHVTSDRS
ncbi:hypothetical protein [Cellulomonas sp. SLBN-39]|uniref:hypothetical protein n=1 Tax=Cellulomonas sp. SLBN-39 TaxID=2768446 RepID=UPI00114F8301|nr:hypothetical protein [Cellulomonas sp. SLBN-39]